MHHKVLPFNGRQGKFGFVKILSYNVNGIRSALSKGLTDYLVKAAPDVICLQEIKAHADQIDEGIFKAMGYHCFWYPAEKKGYSGVAILSKSKPDNLVEGCGISAYDREGRFLRADFGDISVASVYAPSGSSGEDRQDFKMRWLTDFQEFISQLKQKREHLILCGDFNICNKPIDIHNPKSNQKTSGFLPEERAWFDEFLDLGFTDSFRMLNQAPGHYSWWSFRARSRDKNLGWRIDYVLTTNSLKERIKTAGLDPWAVHSDHCPAWMELFPT